MSDCLRCDGPDCDTVGDFPYQGWWRLTNTTSEELMQQPQRLDFCSWQCLGAFTLHASGEVAEIQARIDRE